MTTSKDVLEAVALGQGPGQFMMTLGYAGWNAGQLEDEISRNGWLNVSTNLEQITNIIFETPFAERYQKVMAILGIDPHFLSGEVGHA
jgi:putative transcriptional regulator